MSWNPDRSKMGVMAAAVISRFFLSFSSNHLLLPRYRTFSISLSLSAACNRLLPRLCYDHDHSHIRTFPSLLSSRNPRLLLLPPIRSFASGSNTNSTSSFDWSDDEEEDNDDKKRKKTMTTDIGDKKSKLPPPYDPFSKKPVVEEPRDPSDLQEIFHKMRTEGLTNNAIKMFDALSKDGLTHQAMDLFALIKDKGKMPDVVAHTAVIEAYANAAGHSKDAIRTFDRMLASGVSPNTYTYAVLIKGLARDRKLPEARRYLLQMMAKGMRPNAGTYLAVFEAYVGDQRTDDARTLLEEMRNKGFTPEESAVREHLSKKGRVFPSIMNLLFGK